MSDEFLLYFMELIAKNELGQSSIEMSYFVVLIEQIEFYIKIKAPAPCTEALDWLFRLN